MVISPDPFGNSVIDLNKPYKRKVIYWYILTKIYCIISDKFVGLVHQMRENGIVDTALTGSLNPTDVILSIFI